MRTNISELTMSAELLGFHSRESYLKENEDCLEKFAEGNEKESKEQSKSLTEDISELKQISRTIDKLVGAFKERGKQIEELQQNLKKQNEVSIKKKLDENKRKIKQRSSFIENNLETLITDVEKVQDSMTERKSKNRNQQ